LLEPGEITRPLKIGFSVGVLCYTAAAGFAGWAANYVFATDTSTSACGTLLYVASILNVIAMILFGIASISMGVSIWFDQYDDGSQTGVGGLSPGAYGRVRSSSDSVNSNSDNEISMTSSSARRSPHGKQSRD